ncbi:MAG: hypothetical protein QY326_00710 [Bdellovibrionota bacterium]|nr:MAG: hypothetical protein QY326_00710 [Bdellovibrionota bacterium]
MRQHWRYLEALLLTALILAGPFANSVGAQNPPSWVLRETYIRPRLNTKVPQDVIQNYNYGMNQVNKAADAASGIGSADPGPYDRGASVGEMATNFVHDYGQMLSKLLSCMEPWIVGLCIRFTWHGVSIRPFWEYYLPVQKVENVDQPLKSGYILEIIQTLALNVLDSGIPLYMRGAAEGKTSLEHAIGSAREIGTRYLEYEFEGEPEIEEQQQAIDTVRDVFDKQERFRNPERTDAGVVFNEYHVMPTFWELVLGWLPFLCHNWKPVMLWASDHPYGILPARLSYLSYFTHPIEMLEIYGLPFSGMLGFPQTCGAVNMRSDSGKTPWDMLLTFQYPNYDFRLLSSMFFSPGYGCLGVNQGTWVPYTHMVNNLRHTSAAAVGTAKGLKAARGWFPATFYTSRLKNKEKYKDKFQWTRSDAMKSATGGKCIRLEQWFEKYKQANIANDPKDSWFVALHWKYFRCCPRRHKPFIVWKGDKTQIKE